MTIGILLDVVLIALMAATIGYCVALNRKLAILRAAQAEMAKMIADFDRAAAHARDGLQELRTAGIKASDIAQKIERGRALVDELNFVIEAGESLADRLANSRAPAGVAASAPASAQGERPRSESERELMHALRGVK